MQTSMNNVLSDLKTLSDSADRIIEFNPETEIVSSWFKLIKETATAIVKGTYSDTNEGKRSTSRNSSSKLEVPDLVTLIKGNQSNTGERRVSNLLNEVKKDHVRRSIRKSRKSKKSIRKIVLEKKSGNRWEISNPDIELEDSVKKKKKTDSPTSDIKDDILESRLKTPFEALSANKSSNKKYLPELNNDQSAKQAEENTFCTPVQNSARKNLNADGTSPMTRSRIKALGATHVVKGKQDARIASQNNSVQKSSTCLVKPAGKNSQILMKTSDPKATSNYDEISETPNNQTIIIDSDDNEDSVFEIKTPPQVKRKSSLQHSQENAKKCKKSDSRSRAKNPARSKRIKREENSIENKSSKRIRMVKKTTNPVIPAKTSNDFVQNNAAHAEKRILREIQKKEEIVIQNAQKIKSQREIKIEESKKARELKMEKASQQRLKMEKEKEERLRSRTHSKQEISQQKESTLRKKVLKKESELDIKNSAEKFIINSTVNKHSLTVTKPLNLRADEIVSTSSSKALEKSGKPDISNAVISPIDKPPAMIETDSDKLAKNVASSTFIKTPVKPVRSTPRNTAKNATPALSVKTPVKPDPILAKESVKASKQATEVLVSNNEIFTKPNMNVTYVSSNTSLKDCAKKSPTAKEDALKQDSTKTPVSKLSKKITSYSMTPAEKSFVSYDISEIKDDDEEDDEEEPHTKKPIPCWALGVRLRNTLLNQHYNPVNTDEWFGNCFETPDLVKIMGTQKKHYHKRTSSAIWVSSPNRSILADM